MSDITNDQKTEGEWKIHLTIAINFFSSKESEETRTMYCKSGNIEVMMGNETDKMKTFFILFCKDTQKT